MTQQSTNEQINQSQQRRGRGPSKTFPMFTFEDALALARGISEHGIGGEIQRLTLMDKLSLSPHSSKTRSLITNSARYGLTVGGYSSPTIKITEDASVLFSSATTLIVVKQKEFELAIDRFDSYRSVYDRLKENRLRDEAVLRDEFGRVGISTGDSPRATEIFTANLRYLGLVEEIGGSEQVRAIEIIANRLATTESNESTERELTHPVVPEPLQLPQASSRDRIAAREPTVHIDVQIHIDSSASSAQIDQIFASMARHLYGREG